MTFVFFSDPVFRVRSLPDARGAEAGDAAAAVADAGDRAGDAAEFVLPQCLQVDGRRVPPPDTTGLDPAEGWGVDPYDGRVSIPLSPGVSIPMTAGFRSR